MPRLWFMPFIFIALLPGLAVLAAWEVPISRAALPATETPTPTLTVIPTVGIQSPGTGKALQGNAAILGNTAVDGFTSATLYFGYTQDPTNTWFFIQSFDQPVANGMLAQWDTTTITDGAYDLKLSVLLQDGNKVDKIIRAVRVRNYTPIETDTPTPVTPSATPLPGAPTSTPTRTPTPILPTGTPLPTNPAQLSTAAVMDSLGKGALLVFGLFAILGLYVLLRQRRG
jgi:hypothetical protein